MSPEDVLKHLPLRLTQAKETHVLVVADGDNDSHRIQRLTLHKELAKRFQAVAKNSLPSTLDDLVIRPYEPGYKPDAHELVYFNIVDSAEVQKLIEDITQITKAELFSEEEKVIDNLRFYAIVVGTGEHRGVFLRVYTSKQELSRSRYFASMSRKGTYSAVTNKMFLFDHRIDCFVAGKFIFIRNVPGFQKIFAYYEQLIAKAEETLRTVIARVPIQNAEEFIVGCKKQRAMLTKAARIATQPYINDLTMDDLKRTIAEFKLDVTIANDNGTEKLVYDAAPSKRWLILQLLDDNFLGSVMTKRKYEVNSKSVV